MWDTKRKIDSEHEINFYLNNREGKLIVNEITIYFTTKHLFYATLTKISNTNLLVLFPLLDFV